MIPDVVSKYAQRKKKRATPKIKYYIRINAAKYVCYGYEEIELKVPNKSAWKKIENAWNISTIVVDFITLMAGGEPVLLPLDLSEDETFCVPIVRLIDDKDNKVIDVASQKDEKQLSYVIKHQKPQLDSEFLVFVDDLQSVLGQFTEQYKLHKKVLAARKKAEKEAFIASLKNKKASYYAQITSDFDELNLLSSPSLSNSGKLEAYSNIRDFCCKYIPDLCERSFDIGSIYEMYSDLVSESACFAFKENWNRINRSYNVLSRGASGEKKVFEVLRLFDDRIRILRNYTGERYEHDFIVISPYGISTIEVKTLRGNYVLTETGLLKCLSSDRVKPKDVAFQSKKHLETLRRNLNGCPAFSEKVPLREIICSAEPNFTIRDDYHYIPVCYYNTLDKELFPENGKVVLNNKAMDAIEKYLIENQKEAFKFDIYLPDGEIDSRAEFIKNFADVASGYMAAQE